MSIVDEALPVLIPLLDVFVALRVRIVGVVIDLIREAGLELGRRHWRITTRILLTHAGYIRRRDNFIFL